MKYAGVVAYDGTGFAGWQKQGHGERTVQGDLEIALSKILNQPITTFGASRTDVGVHADGQAFHFEAESEKHPNNILKAMNATLQKDMVVKQIKVVKETFHACYSAKAKMYEYHVYRHPIRSVMNRNRELWIPYELDLKAMQIASKYFLGTHDFSALCPKSRLKEDPTRTIMICNISSKGPKIVFQIKGDGFMYHMVRIIVGTLIEVGAGKRKAVDIPNVLESRDRDNAGVAVPAHGLRLVKVYY